jgi:hypothetical protein
MFTRIASSVPTRITSVLTSHSRIWVAASAALLLGAVARALRPFLNSGGLHYDSIGAIALLGVALLVLAWRAPNLRSFQLLSIASWIGFTAGWSAAHLGFWGDLLGVSSAGAAVSAVVGGGMVFLRAWRAGVSQSRPTAA